MGGYGVAVVRGWSFSGSSRAVFVFFFLFFFNVDEAGAVNSGGDWKAYSMSVYGI